MPTKVYHAWPRNPRQAFSDRLIKVDEARLTLVAHLATNDLEQAFAWTQHLEVPWHTQTERVLALQPGPYPLIGERRSAYPRSTSVGDVMETMPDGQRFLVGSLGFVSLAPRPAPPIRFPLHMEERRHIGPFQWDVALAWRLVGQRPAPALVASPMSALPAAELRRVAVEAVEAVVAPAPDGRDPLRFVSRTLLARLGDSNMLQALSDAVDPRTPLLVAPAQAMRRVSSRHGPATPLAGSVGPTGPTGVVPSLSAISAGPADQTRHAGRVDPRDPRDPRDPTDDTPLSEAVLVDGRQRVAKALLEGWPSVPYYRLSMPEVALCCDAFTPFLTTRAAALHACGYPLTDTWLTLDGRVWQWQGDAVLPLLRTCPRCGARLPCVVS